MKFSTIFAAALILIPSLCLASADARPESISCVTVKGSKYLPKKFAITGLNTDEPSTDISDAELVDPLKQEQIDKDDMLSPFFSNQCDNGYVVSLSQQALVDLKSGAVRSITGTIEGGSADGDGGIATLVCRLR